MPYYRSACQCRKPAPGMLQQAAQEPGIDLTRSWTIGDSPCDIDAGRRAGTDTVLVATTPLHYMAADAHCATTAEALCQVVRHHRVARRSKAAVESGRLCICRPGGEGSVHG
ncbi:HAD hydrolase-like protein [Streptomyces sp. NPDC090077]|uniref:HAD hydrolase-like protein n=1 Tax=Streptomyces sp. NPDC090077 TaxID=3365938 RepID=UPI0037FD2FE1